MDQDSYLFDVTGVVQHGEVECQAPWETEHSRWVFIWQRHERLCSLIAIQLCEMEWRLLNLLAKLSKRVIVDFRYPALRLPRAKRVLNQCIRISVIVEEVWKLTSRTEAKSSLCLMSASPNNLFSGPIKNLRPVRMESTVLIVLTKCSAHFSGAARRMTSIYSQLDNAAWVTAKDPGTLVW